MAIRPTDIPPEDIIDLEPITTADGCTVWGHLAPTENVTPAITVKPNGVVTRSGDAVPLSTLPTERMSANGHWDRIVESIQAAEAGRTPPDEIVVQPGGTLVPVNRGTAGAELSKLPEDRMAAHRATRNDLAEARRLDPNDVEGWTFVDDPVIPGLRFHMRPVVRRYVFFTFRSPSHGGQWFLSPLDPSFDHLYGHVPHMLRLPIGGEKVPIVCRNDHTSAHRNLAELRGTAAKFATYHDLRSEGQVPFSA